MPGRVRALCEDLDPEDLEEVEAVVNERLEGINPAQAVIYGLKDDDVAGWLAGTSLDR